MSTDHKKSLVFLSPDVDDKRSLDEFRRCVSLATDFGDLVNRVRASFIKNERFREITEEEEQWLGLQFPKHVFRIGG